MGFILYLDGLSITLEPEFSNAMVPDLIPSKEVGWATKAKGM